MLGKEAANVRTSRERNRALALMLLAMTVALPVSPAGRQSLPSQQTQRTRGVFDSTDDFDPLMAERRAKALNVARQKSLVADTDKLLALARELNTEVSASDADTLTPIQQRKIAEIEKLAHSVKDKMSDATSGAPVAPEFTSPLDH
jgi:hypothetical protein